MALTLLYHFLSRTHRYHIRIPDALIFKHTIMNLFYSTTLQITKYAKYFKFVGAIYQEIDHNKKNVRGNLKLITYQYLIIMGQKKVDKTDDN